MPVKKYNFFFFFYLCVVVGGGGVGVGGTYEDAHAVRSVMFPAFLLFDASKTGIHSIHAF